MKNILTIPAALILAASLLETSGLGQSDHARRIAASFRETQPKYVTDILVTKPDYVVFAPKANLDVCGDTYNDHFQVFDKPDGTLFAVWTQATREGFSDHHIMFSRSADKGLTWTAPRALAGSLNRVNPQLLASWQQPMVSRSGRIYVLWNQQVTSRGPHCGLMFGIFSDNNGDTWSAPQLVPMKRSKWDDPDPTVPPSWCNWQRPLRLGKDGRYLVGVSRHAPDPKTKRGRCTIEFLQFDNIDDNPAVKDIQLSWFSGDDDVLVVEHERFGSACEEASIVKLPDGRLFALMRTCGGYPYWSVSGDDGRSWSRPKPLRDRDGGKPYLHPRSPCPIYDRKGPEAASGDYFAFVHNTFDFQGEREYQNRGPLFLIAGRFQPGAEQPIWFAPMQLFVDRPGGNSFYCSSTVVDGKTILWYPDKKFYLLGRVIGDEWFKHWDRPSSR
ncbi:MAG: exo-alpha-sialidase [Verrucomicrobia bacterium]|nr:exo-alpha-sialidase [Verrucomicrobiota bacterium]